jgi:hypothetical protein
MATKLTGRHACIQLQGRITDVTYVTTWNQQMTVQPRSKLHQQTDLSICWLQHACVQGLVLASWCKVRACKRSHDWTSLATNKIFHNLTRDWKRHALMSVFECIMWPQKFFISHGSAIGKCSRYYKRNVWCQFNQAWNTIHVPQNRRLDVALQHISNCLLADVSMYWVLNTEYNRSQLLARWTERIQKKRTKNRRTYA